MAGFGTLQEFNDSLKRNRELAKANKKKPFDRDNIYAVKEKTLLQDGKTLTATEREELLNKVQLENRKERRRKLLILFTSLFLTFALIVSFLVIWRNW